MVKELLFAFEASTSPSMAQALYNFPLGCYNGRMKVCRSGLPVAQKPVSSLNSLLAAARGSSFVYSPLGIRPGQGILFVPKKVRLGGPGRPQQNYP